MFESILFTWELETNVLVEPASAGYSRFGGAPTEQSYKTHTESTSFIASLRLGWIAAVASKRYRIFIDGKYKSVICTHHQTTSTTTNDARTHTHTHAQTIHNWAGICCVWLDENRQNNTTALHTSNLQQQLYAVVGRYVEWNTPTHPICWWRCE